MKIALFAEGMTAPDARGFGDQFLPLWRTLLSRAGIGGDVAIHGFHKGHVVSMTPKYRRYLPFDVHIAQIHRKDPFDVLVIAFDREPRHEGLQHTCRHDEVKLLLDGLASSTSLPAPFAGDAATLRDGYEAVPRPAPRPPGRPPRLHIDVVCMEPMFEGLFLEDQAGFREVLGLRGKRVRDWPHWDTRTARPDRQVLGKAVACADAEIRRFMRKPFDQDKHGWAHFLLEKLPDNSPVWGHDIVARLRTVLA